MARIPALVAAFAEFDPRDRSTLEQFARVVREHGGLPTVKRGRGAATMGAAEAAALFMALNGSETPKGAMEALEGFRALPLVRAPKNKEHLIPDFLKQALSQGQFGGALAEFIRVIPQIRDYVVDNLSKESKLTKAESWEEILESGSISVGLSKSSGGMSANISIVLTEAQNDGALRDRYLRWTWSNYMQLVDEKTWLIDNKNSYRTVTVDIAAKPIFCLSKTIDPESWIDECFKSGWHIKSDSHAS